MIDFKYCIWLRPEKNHIWEAYCDGFKPHISIKTKLNESDIEHDIESNLIKYNNQVILPEEVEVCLKGDVIYDVEEGFHSLYYHVDCLTTPPAWWPENAHISFKYKYNTPFTPEEIEHLRNKINIWRATFRQISIVKCTGHYKDWICS